MKPLECWRHGDEQPCCELDRRVIDQPTVLRFDLVARVPRGLVDVNDKTGTLGYIDITREARP